MSELSEIKCPACGKWSKWTGKVDERCPHCHEYLDAGRVRYAEEQKMTTAANRKSGYLIIKDTDDPIVQMGKQFINWLRWTTFYGISAIYIVIAVMVIVYGLFML
jgi:hypothetical protein